MSQKDGVTGSSWCEFWMSHSVTCYLKFESQGFISPNFSNQRQKWHGVRRQRYTVIIVHLTCDSEQTFNNVRSSGITVPNRDRTLVESDSSRVQSKSLSGIRPPSGRMAKFCVTVGAFCLYLRCVIRTSSKLMYWVKVWWLEDSPVWYLRNGRSNLNTNVL